MFHQLDAAHIVQIVGIMLKELAKRIAESGIIISVTEAAKEILAKEGFDPLFGARPLRRAIVRRIEDEMSERVLTGEFKEGDQVQIDASGDVLTFTKA